MADGSRRPGRRAPGGGRSGSDLDLADGGPPRVDDPPSRLERGVRSDLQRRWPMDRGGRDAALPAGGGPAPIWIWRTADRRELMTLHPGWNVVSDLTFSADGRWIAAAGTPRSRRGEVRLRSGSGGRRTAAS